MEIINYVGFDKTKTSHSASSRTEQRAYNSTMSAMRPAGSVRDRINGKSRLPQPLPVAAGLRERTALNSRSILEAKDRTAQFHSHRIAERDRTAAGAKSTVSLRHETSTSFYPGSISAARTVTSNPSLNRLGGGNRLSNAGALKFSSVDRKPISSMTATGTVSATPMSTLLKGEKSQSAQQGVTRLSISVASMPKNAVASSSAAAKPSGKDEAKKFDKLQESIRYKEQGVLVRGVREEKTTPPAAINGIYSAGAASTAAIAPCSPLAFIGKLAHAVHTAIPGTVAFAAAAGIGVILVMGADWYASHTGPLALQDGSTAELDALSFIMQTGGRTIDASTDELQELGIASAPVIKSTVTWQTYKVSPGDTIIGLTHRFGLENISTIIAVNGVDNARALRAGQKIRIPSMDGLVYKVRAGNSLEGISSKYSVSMEDILDVNDLATKDLSAGQELFIPGAAMDNTALREAMGDLFKCPIRVPYRLSSHFGWRADPFTGVRSYHSGVDMACPQGTSIYAAMGGRIITAGWSNVFGNYVIVDHQNGYQSLYGHMSKRIARKGQVVNQGDLLGLVGSTGYSTGPHLHFTVYKKGRLTDPLVLLRR